MRLNNIILSVPTSANSATPAATFAFMTSGYRPARQGRSIGEDIVHNQNGIFGYVYDNGPNVRVWDPFVIRCDDAFKGQMGSATQQAANLDFMWQYHEGPMTMQAPDGTYPVHWAATDLARQFVSFPAEVGDKLVMDVTVNLEEG